MVVKQAFIGNTGEDSDIHCSGLHGDRTLSYFYSFIQKIVLKGHSLVAVGETLLFMFIIQVSHDIELLVNMIALLKR